MPVETNPERFTLRREYFGGFVYDARTAKHELLTPTEEEAVRNMTLADSTSFDRFIQGDPGLAERVSAFQKFGFIDRHPDGSLSLVSVRAVQPPDSMPDGMLTAPIRVFDTYTKRCNFSCDHCYFSSDSSVVESRRTIEQTADIIHQFYDAGSMEWRFTGGEALTQPDLFEAIAITKDLGMNVGLYTNGWWSPDAARRILDSNLDEIVISLEGREEINDSRRKPGAYKKAIDTLNLISEYNRSNPGRKIRVTIATAVGKDNMEDTEFLIRLAAGYGYNVNFIPLKPSGRARGTMQEALPSTEEFMRFSQTVQRMREDPEVVASGINISHKYKDLFCPTYPDSSAKPFPFNYSECGALTTAITLLPDGQLISCPFVFEQDVAGEFSGPNLTEVPLKEAWRHPNFDKFRNAEKTDCVGCEYYMRQCRGACKATVLGYGGRIEDGKLKGSDPYCYAPIMPNSE
jgi:radical SAM protein with 4Fe4S-binding SPASM domain